MIRVSVTELKTRLSEYLRRVKGGETLEIVERSVPIARVEAIRPRDLSDDEQLERLVSAGVVRPRLGPPDLGFLDRPPIPCQADGIRAVVEERGER